MSFPNSICLPLKANSVTVPQNRTACYFITCNSLFTDRLNIHRYTGYATDSVIENMQSFFLDCMTPVDGLGRLFRKVGEKLIVCAAENSKRAQISCTLRRKPEVMQDVIIMQVIRDRSSQTFCTLHFRSHLLSSCGGLLYIQNCLYHLKARIKARSFP
jgi:hypothetical protein